MDSVDENETMMICYYYYPRVAYWIIVCVASAIILLISYLSLYAICCKVNPFQRCLKKRETESAQTEQDSDQKSMESVIRFYQFMFGITVILLIFSILLSTVLSKLCFDGISNLFEEQYVAAILVLISYVMVSMTLNLLWFSTNSSSSSNGGLCKVVAVLFGVAVLIHFSGIAMLCYWMKVGEPDLAQSGGSLNALKAFYNTKLNNTAILLMVMVTTITYTTFWLFICKIFKYRFCCNKKQQPLDTKELTINLV